VAPAPFARTSTNLSRVRCCRCRHWDASVFHSTLISCYHLTRVSCDANAPAVATPPRCRPGNGRQLLLGARIRWRNCPQDAPQPLGRAPCLRPITWTRRLFCLLAQTNSVMGRPVHSCSFSRFDCRDYHVRLPPPSTSMLQGRYLDDDTEPERGSARLSSLDLVVCHQTAPPSC
jgi:hypothetical protein